MKQPLLKLGATLLGVFCAGYIHAQMTSMDVGGPTPDGSAVTNPDNTVAVTGGGADIWGTADQMQYWYRSVVGDEWDVVVRCRDLTMAGSTWAKCELMVRNPDASGKPTAGDPFIAMMTTPDANQGGVDVFSPQFRSVRGGNADQYNPRTLHPLYPNVWMKIKRVAKQFTIEYGPDGVNWTNYVTFDTAASTVVGSDNAQSFGAGKEFGDPVYVGVAVTSHSQGESVVATVSDFKINLPAKLAIGQPVGAPLGFTVSVQNGPGTIADPATAQAKLDGAAVTPSKTDVTASGVVFTYTTAPLQPLSEHVVDFTIKSTTGVAFTQNGMKFTVPKYGLIPESAALAANTVDKTKPGFKLRMSQSAQALGNSTAVTEANLTGAYGPNIASTASYVNGYTTEAAVINYNVDLSTGQGDFPTGESSFPGVPAATGGSTENFAMEALTVLEFPKAGLYTMIVNSDDGFTVAAYGLGPDIKASSSIIGEFSGGRGASDTSFQLYIPKAGLYGFRMTMEQGGGGGNVEWILVNDAGEKTLINASDSIKAYAAADVLKQQPYFEQATPNSPAEEQAVTIVATVVNADTSVVSGSMKMKFDGQNVGTPTSAGGKTTISYTPAQLPMSSSHAVEVTYQESGGTTVTRAWTFQVHGAITRRIFTDISGTSISNLKSAETYIANTPTEVATTASVDINNYGDNYGVDFMGYFVPFTTADYTFYVAGDDNCQVWLSTDESIANMKQICAVSSWDNYREYLNSSGGSAMGPGPGGKISNPIPLVANKKYFLWAAMKEGGGGDSIALTWWKPGDAPIANGDVQKSAELQAGFQGEVAVTPASVAVVEGRPFKLVGTALAPEGGMTYQWKKNGQNVAGETLPTLARAPAATGDSGAYTLVVTVAAPGGTKTLTSKLVQVTVAADTFPPVPAVGALVAGGTTEVGVTFGDDIMNAATVGNAANYSISKGTISSVTAVANSYGTYNAALLKVSGLVAGDSAVLTVKDTADTFGNKTAATQVPFTVGGKVSWAEVGSPKVKGQVIAVGADGFDVVSGGRGYWANYDEVDIAYMTKTGDFDVKVQLVEAESSSQWARCGIAARNELNVGMARPADSAEVSTASAYCELHANPNQTLAATWDPNDPVQVANPTPNNNFEQNQRISTGAQTSGWGSPAGNAPDYPNVWLRLKRTADIIMGYKSLDGQTWTATGQTILTTQSPTMYVGPCHGPESGNLWGSGYDVWGSTTDPKYDRTFVAKYRNFTDVTTSTPTVVTIGKNANGSVTISWDKPGKLQQRASLNGGAWADVPGVTGQSYTTTTPGFYQVLGQ